jgi:hypothetical protein
MKWRTRSGVCFCRMVTRCSQKSRFDRKPPRTAFPESSLPDAAESSAPVEEMFWSRFCEFVSAVFDRQNFN